jgi:hypothetical protein
MKDLYEENGLKFFKKLIVENHYQWETEENFQGRGKDQPGSEELETYKKIAGELEEKLERTNHYYQVQIISYERKAHFN